MVSSRVMPSSSTAASSDLVALQPASKHPLAAADPPSRSAIGDDPAGNLGSMNIDDLLRGFYGETEAAVDGDVRVKTAEEVWKEISSAAQSVAGGEGSGHKERAAAAAVAGREITLEDFLARAAGAAREEDVGVLPRSRQAGFVVDPPMADRFAQHERLLPMENPVLGLGNGVESRCDGGVGGGGRGCKRQIIDSMDKAATRRQKRMIKNRESAARSRERKQAYTVELESLVMRLEEENARLLREKEEHHRLRLQQLMENLIPVTEMKKPPRVLRRMHSTQW